MGSFRKNSLAAVIIAAILKTVSCTPGSCLEETIAKTKVPFYLSSTQKIKAPDSLTIYGINNKSNKLYSSSRSVTRADLPLNPSTESCGFVLRINGVSDTLLLTYDSYAHFISKECGYTYYYKIDSLSFTKNIIDTIIIKNRFVTTVNEENFRILY
jgi:predicted nucleic-acid-binding Zn-ribbon protein